MIIKRPYLVMLIALLAGMFFVAGIGTQYSWFVNMWPFKFNPEMYGAMLGGLVGGLIGLRLIIGGKR